MLQKFSHQHDEGPLENLKECLAEADHPTHALISIGATRYTDFGATHFLKPNDLAVVALYDTRHHTEKDIQEYILSSRPPSPHMSLLRQHVVQRKA